jgi:CrcB protein
MHPEAQKIALVLAGGALGTGCRYALSSLVYRWMDKPTFPWANLVINVSGCFAIGVLVQLFETRALVSPAARAALLTGVLGGYTTFSSFAFETMALLRDGETALALLNAAGSLGLGLAAVWVGMRLAQILA